MKISVIICTKDREKDLKIAINTLIHQIRLPDELIVVDSTTPPILSGYFSSEKFPFPIIYKNTLPGLPRQRNIGIDLSHGDLLFFFDDDVLITPEYINIIEQVFLKDKKSIIGAVSGRITNYRAENISLLSKMKQMLYDCFSNIFLLHKFGNGNFRFSGNATHPHKDKFDHYIECLSGCCMSFRKKIFDRVRFDENLNGYAFMEDIDISKQVIDHDYKIYYSAAAKLIHNVSKAGRMDERRLYKMVIRNKVYLFNKNWSRSLLRKAAFVWSLAGFFIINSHHKSRRQGIVDALLHAKD